jgi:cell wall-associated NlpC family hydrolase
MSGQDDLPNNVPPLDKKPGGLVSPEAEQRAAVDRVAREFVGTPYHDGACVKGAGIDCAQLLRAVFVEAGIIDDLVIHGYSGQHFLHSDKEEYLGYVTRYAHEIEREQAKTGDVVLYKIAKCYAHGAIIVAPGWPNIIHAHYHSRMVRQGHGLAVHLGTPILGMKFFSFWP